MKLIFAIVHDQTQEKLSDALTSAGFGVTAIASSGGFLKRGMTTLLVGVEDDKVNSALETIRGNCHPLEEGGKSAVIFVLKVDDFSHF